MKFMNKTGMIFDKIIDYAMLASAIMVVLLAVVVSEDVIVRKLFDFTWPPLFEIVEYTLLWMTFLGTAWILRKGTHIRMDSILGRLSTKNQSLINTITSILCAFLLAGMTFYTIKLTVYDYQTHFQLATILNPVKWPIEIVVPFGFFLLFVQSVRNANSSLSAYKALTKPGTAVVPAALPGKEQA